MIATAETMIESTFMVKRWALGPRAVSVIQDLAGGTHTPKRDFLRLEEQWGLRPRRAPRRACSNDLLDVAL